MDKNIPAGQYYVRYSTNTKTIKTINMEEEVYYYINFSSES
jgi:hypothetical protein